MRSAPLVGDAKGTRLKLCFAAAGAMISADLRVACVGVANSFTLPETNIAPENEAFPTGNQSSNHPFSGAMLVSGRVDG